LKRKGQKNSEEMRLKGKKTKTRRGGSHKHETTRRSESKIRNQNVFYVNDAAEQNFLHTNLSVKNSIKLCIVVLSSGFDGRDTSTSPRRRIPVKD
jgi:hypothetical protein